MLFHFWDLESWSCVFNALSSALVCSEFTLSWGVIILSNPNAVPVIILFLIDSEESATQLNTSMNIYCNSKGGSGCLLMSEVTTQTSQCPNSENCCLLSCDRFLIEIVKCLLILGNHLYNHVQSVYSLRRPACRQMGKSEATQATEKAALAQRDAADEVSM